MALKPCYIHGNNGKFARPTANGVSDPAPSFWFLSINRSSLILGTALGPSSRAVADSVSTWCRIGADLVPDQSEHGDPYAAKGRFLFFYDQKGHQKTNDFPTSQKTTPGAQVLVFIDFFSFLGALFPSIFQLFPKCQIFKKPSFSFRKQYIFKVQTSQNSLFWRSFFMIF